MRQVVTNYDCVCCFGVFVLITIQQVCGKTPNAKGGCWPMLIWLGRTEINGWGNVSLTSGESN